MTKRIRSVLRLLTCVLILVANKGFAQEKFEKASFYDVMANGGTEEINKELDIVTNSSVKIKDGYEGALLMKKAGLAGNPHARLKLFKQGRVKFETAITADPENVELHFLRLAIEEHAPKIVKYHNDIDNDKLYIQQNFKNLSPVVQHAILDYTKRSKVLKADDLKLAANE